MIWISCNEYISLSKTKSSTNIAGLLNEKISKGKWYDLKVDFINECVSKLVLGSSDYYEDMLDDWDINESKKNICDKWGKHIPSLLKEIREKKLNKILWL